MIFKMYILYQNKSNLKKIELPIFDLKLLLYIHTIQKSESLPPCVSYNHRSENIQINRKGAITRILFLKYDKTIRGS